MLYSVDLPQPCLARTSKKPTALGMATGRVVHPSAHLQCTRRPLPQSRAARGATAASWPQAQPCAVTHKPQSSAVQRLGLWGVWKAGRESQWHHSSPRPPLEGSQIIYRWWLLLFGVCVRLFGLLFKGTRPFLESVRKSSLENIAS